MGILDIFKAGTAPANPTPASTAQQNSQNANQMTDPRQAAAAAAQGVPVAMQGTPAGNPAEQKSPLEEFKGLFKIEPNKDDPEQALSQQLFSTDPDKLRQVVSGINFMEGADEQMMERAMSGDAKAMMQLINTAAQNAFLRGTQTSTGMIQQGVDHRLGAFQKVLPNRFRSFMVQNSPVQRPELNHEAIKPLVDAVRDQVMRSDPTLTPDQIQETTMKYLQAIGQTLSPAQKNQQQSEFDSQHEAAMDFSKFFPSQR